MKHNFDEIVDRRGTYCTQWDYIQDRFGTNDVLPFSISDTDFRIPKPISNAIMKVAEHEVYGYTRWNHDDFKEAICSFYKRRFQCTIQPEWIVYSPSVMYSVSLLIRLLSEAGDSVLTMNPMYDAFFHVIEDNHRNLVSIDLDLQEDGYHIDFPLFEEAVQKCTIFLLCSPHNPTGRIWKNEEMRMMIQLCKKYNVAIISDEIHMDIQIKERKHIPALHYLTYYDNIYIASSCSKTLNVPGLIGSYAILPSEKLYDLFLHQTRKKDFLNSVSIFGMYAHMVGYKECDEYIDDLSEYVKSNLYMVRSFLQEHVSDMKLILPDATYLAWIDCRSVPFTSEAIQDALVNIGKVAIMKGETYGSNGTKFLRMNCGCPKEKLIDGLWRIKKAMDALYETAREQNEK